MSDPVPPSDPVVTSAPSDPTLARRPVSVTAALVLTWSGAFLFSLLGALMLARASDTNLLAGVERTLGRPIDRAYVSEQLRLLGAVMLPWGLAVIAVAAFAGRRRHWARLALTVMGALCCAVALYLTVDNGGLGGPLTVAWVAVAVGLLWTGSARQWYAERHGRAPAYDAHPPLP